MTAGTNMTNYEKYEECAKTMADLLKEHSTEMVQEMAEKMFAVTDGLNGIVYYVWTPSWNDGEECTQQYDVDFDFFDHIDTDIEDNAISTEQEQTILNLFDLELLDAIHKDNFKVIILREEDGINVIVEDYDCGY